jgi:hypothetical protein
LAGHWGGEGPWAASIKGCHLLVSVAKLRDLDALL